MDLVYPNKKKLPFYESKQETFNETKQGTVKTKP